MATQLDEAINGNIGIKRAMREADIDIPEPPKGYQPVYRVMADTKIPIPKSAGKLWRSRHDAAKAYRTQKLDDKAWSEAVAYFRNDHSQDRTEGRGGDYEGRPVGRMGKRSKETENLVFANATALVPALYAKTPIVEATPIDETDAPFVKSIERLVNRLMELPYAPGIGIKSRARRAVVSAVLKNLAYIEIGYTLREASSEQALNDLQRLSTELQKAKDVQAVQEIEGKIMALEQTVDFLRPSGPWARFRRPEDVLVDPDSMEEDLSDARWVMIHDYVSTEFIRAKYGEKDDKGNWKLIYAPTHYLSMSSDGRNEAEQEVLSYTQLIGGDNTNEHTRNGFTDEESYRKAQRTGVWMVWDAVTRRLLMFNEKDWTWPIWVWDDPYKLDKFFPIYELSFYKDPERGAARGEVTYYLDQQDAVNQINNEMKLARAWARRNLFYNNNTLNKSEVEAYLRGDDEVAVAVDVPDGQKLTEQIYSAPPPSMQFLQLFDKQPLYESIDRVSSVMPVMRGIEFKTNTTNKAVETYNSTQQTRLDEKIDAVEDLIGSVAWGVAQLCVEFMPQVQVAELIGPVAAQPWLNMTPRDLGKRVQTQLVGGSTAKPTSMNKQRMALEVGQVLGQFTSAAPAAVTTVLLRVFEKAFDEVVIQPEDWQVIQQEMAAQIQAQTQQPTEGQPTGGDPLAGLPPEAQAAVQDAIAQGVPPEAALAQVQQMLQGQGAMQ